MPGQDHRQQRPSLAISNPAASAVRMTEPSEHANPMPVRVYGDPVIDFLRLVWFD